MQNVSRRYILIGENWEKVSYSLDRWRLAVEGRGLRISKSGTEYVEYEIGGREQEIDDTRRVMSRRDVR